jgi:disulfide bond formation protein DsbB
MKLRAALPRLSLATLIVGGGALGLLLGALAMQYWGGLAPCHLCLLQRGPLVAGSVLALMAFASAPFQPSAGRLALGAAGLCLLLSAGIGVYHSGVELHWWAGPDTCSGGFQMPKSGTDFAAGLDRARVVRCDAVAWSLAGLSLANYNVFFSGALACLAGWMAVKRESQ